MRDLKNNLTSGKSTKNTKSRKGKSFGYQVLGFGAGGSKGPPLMDYLVVAGGGGGQQGGAGAGGYRTSFPGGTQMELVAGTPYPVTIGAAAGPGTQRGSDSTSTGGSFNISSTGGGRGGPAGAFPTQPPSFTKSGWPGGSGGGAATGNPQAGGGSGNAGGYSPPEGNGGGQNYPLQPGGAGGGGAAQNGSPGPALTPTGGKGGDGAANSITGSSVGYAGGGGGQPGSNGQYGGPTGIGGGGGGSTGGGGRVILRGPGDYTYTAAPGSNSVAAQPDGTVVITMTVTGTIQAD
jgi:hypothetical protein